MAIPFVLVSFIYRRRDVPFHWIFLMFGAFIVFCGFTHFLEVVTTRTPVYRFTGLIKVATAAVSWATVAALVPLVPKALAMRTPEELEREIAERKRLEALLQQRTEEWLRSIASHARCILWSADVRDVGAPQLQWDLKLVDEEAAQRFFPVEIPPGRSYFEAWHDSRLPEDRLRTDEYGPSQVRQGHSYIQEFRCRRADGEIRWLMEEVKIETIAPGQWRAVGVCIDVTERKRADAERAQVQALTDAALAHLSLDQLLPELLERIRHILFADAATILLLEEDHLRVRAVQGLDLEAEIEHGVRVPIGKGFAGRIAATRAPLAVQDLDQFEVWTPLMRSKGIRSLLGVPLLVEGRVLGVLHVGALHTRQFAPSEIRLLQLVADRVAMAVDHARLFEELARENQHKDQFLAMLSHELRNPLGAISNAVQILNLIGPAEPRMVRAREIIERQVNHQRRLLDDLLNVSRIAQGKLALQPARLELTRLVRETADDFRAEIEAVRQTLTVELPPQEVWVEGDATRLAQAVSNLLHNAVKFTDAGGEIQLRLTVEPDSEQARVTVTDTGMGIDPALLPHVFQPFVQADRTLDRNRGGLGLGLALVKGLVELHGGRVRAESEGVGRGAALSFWLPLATAPAPSAAVPTPLPSGPLRVLIIEDNLDAAESLRELLEIAGCTVAVARTGLEGLSTAPRFHPEIVLCDLGLPGMDGYEVARRLRQDPVYARVRLIALSGYGQEEDLRLSHEAGFDLHLTKPVQFTELQQLLKVTPMPRET